MSIRRSIQTLLYLNNSCIVRREFHQDQEVIFWKKGPVGEGSSIRKRRLYHENSVPST